MPSKSQRDSLPFEPKSSKPPKDNRAAGDSSEAAARSKGTSSATASAKKERQRRTSSSQKDDVGIPEVVSRRMIRRMAVFAGVPTFLGMSSFIIAYVLLTQHIAEFPNVVVLLVSLGFFGLGTVGLSYGVLSASWQEDSEGSLLGIEEFSVNLRRLVQGLRKSKQSSAPD
ncbi:MAG: PAM68 family protein [Cyanobacteria bacterium P01_B01_bin.77]